MKKTALIFLMALVCQVCKSQPIQADSIKKYLTMNTDVFTGVKNLLPKAIIEGVTKDGFKYYMWPSYSDEGKYISIVIKCPELRCIDKNAPIDYLFINKKTSHGYHCLSANCKGEFVSVYKGFIGIEPGMLNQFCEARIKSIILTAATSIAEIGLTDDQAQLFKNQITWIKYYWDNKNKINKLTGW